MVSSPGCESGLSNTARTVNVDNPDSWIFRYSRDQLVPQLFASDKELVVFLQQAIGSCVYSKGGLGLVAFETVLVCPLLEVVEKFL